MDNIKEASLEDLDALADLFDAYRIFYGKSSDLSAAFTFLKARLENNESKIYVAKSDDKLVGFVQLYPLFSSTRMKRLWLLNDLYVDQNYRGKGFSKKLIEKAKELCRESGSCGMMLETAKSNIIGNQLYPATGFVLDHEHNYYSWDV